jgi:hypothetical protein
LYIFGISSWQTIHVSISSFHFFWRRCPSLGLSQIIFLIWYDFSHIFYFSNFYCK